MFILARRLGVLDRSDVKIITCGVMCAALSCSARLNSRALTITPPWSVNKLDPSKHKRENYESHSNRIIQNIYILFYKSLKLLVSQATFLDRGLKRDMDRVSRILLQIAGSVLRGGVRKATSDPRGTFCIKMLIFLAQSSQPLVTTL